MLVDVIMGGPGGEAAVSRLSGAAIAAGLRQKGHDVAVVDIGARLDPAGLRPGAVVFNTVHGIYGEDGRLQAELDALGRRYVGSGATASRLCMDKQAAKDRVAAHGVPVIPGAVIPAGEDGTGLVLDDTAGLVLKPRSDGSSVGLHLVERRAALPALIAAERGRLGPVDFLVERRLPGPEYTVGILDGPTGPQALPPICIVPVNTVYDYEAKYLSDRTAYLFPAGSVLVAELSRLGLAAHRACGCRHFSRVDLIADPDGRLHFLEINTLPGFTSHSLLPKAAARAGMEFAVLVDQLVHLAATETP
jgi:D-alanine-D-alanine ligase